MNSYDTRTWAWEAQINALKSELDVQVAENERLAQDYNTARDAHDALLLENERLRAGLDKMQRSRDRYRQAWEAEKAFAALGGDE